MDTETFKHFKYEIALGAEVPMPKPKLDVFPNSQYTVQQFLHAICKEHPGSLGKRNGKWEFGGEAAGVVALGTRPEITQIFDFSEQLGIIVPGEEQDGFVPYKLSEAYWTKFDKYAS